VLPFGDLDATRFPFPRLPMGNLPNNDQGKTRIESPVWFGSLLFDHLRERFIVPMSRSEDAVVRSPVIPKRLSLVHQTADILTREVSKGTWEQWLPSERFLSQSLKISRPTLRNALKRLQAEGIVEAVQGVGNRIIAEKRDSARIQLIHKVHLLCPNPLDRIRLQANLWTDELRNRLFQTGTRLLAHHGQQYLRSNPDAALEHLIARHPDGCWILAHSTPQIQAWFRAHHIPCLVAGYTHPGIDLPFVSIDMEVACRHAVGVFVDSGHHSIGFVHLKSERVRDLRSAVGFEAGIRESDVAGKVVTHTDDVDSVRQAIHELLRIGSPTTAILTGTALSFATVATFLMQQGLRIPQDVSLISREHEPFLDALMPQPSCYFFDPLRYGGMVHAKVTDILEGTSNIPDEQHLVPEYRAGQSTRTMNVPNAVPALAELRQE
jgi:DNA-binding LacI/PurR family transcriptional regulator/DNA-binding transcriptional ArsR family regulator